MAVRVYGLPSRVPYTGSAFENAADGPRKALI